MDKLEHIPRKNWPCMTPNNKRFNIWASSEYLVQAFHERDGITRLTVGPAVRKAALPEQPLISWEVLQEIKSACGYGDFDAVEFYPPVSDEKKGGHQRHLWIYPKTERLSFPWRNPGRQISLLREMLNRDKYSPRDNGSEAH